MALVTPATNPGPSPDGSAILLVPPIVGLQAGEDLLAVAPCYIKTSDGKVYMSNGTAANEAAEFAGFCPRATKSGQPVTLYGLGAQFRYATFSGQAGDKLFIAATAGRLDTAATTGDAVGVARVLDTERIQVTRAI